MFSSNYYADCTPFLKENYCIMLQGNGDFANFKRSFIYSSNNPLNELIKSSEYHLYLI